MPVALRNFIPMSLSLRAPRLLPALIVFASALLTGCAAGPTPRVKVLGAEQVRAHAGGPSLIVFVEVVNPTDSDLALSRLEYDLSADALLRAKGSARVDRRIGPDSSAVVEISVPVERKVAAALPGASYRLAGKLFAHGDHMEQFWKVEVKGELARSVASDHVLRVKLGPSSSSE
jgi:hypothetical protein